MTLFILSIYRLLLEAEAPQMIGRGEGPGPRGITGEVAKVEDALALPPLPEGVVKLQFADFFVAPIGPRGLEYTEKIRTFDGKRVRILGHMVRQSDPHPGLFLLAPLPVTLHEHEYGLCDDLPGATLHVFLPKGEESRVAPYTPGFLLLTGTLRVGPREEADGRISTARLELDEPAPAVIPGRSEEEKNPPGSTSSPQPPFEEKR